MEKVKEAADRESESPKAEWISLAIERHTREPMGTTLYPLGYAFYHGFTNWKLFCRLPITLLAIARGNAYKRIRRKSRKLENAGRSQQELSSVESPKSKMMPAIEMPRVVASDELTIAVILDEFSEHCLRYEATLVLLSPSTWREEMERFQPAFLLVESAWKGNDEAWGGMITRYAERNNSPLRKVLQFCRSRGIRTVFWSKEDPPNFNLFIDAAREFDCVFTSDADSIPIYQTICGHSRIYAMPFAAQPRLHNPRRNASWPRYTVCFAGSWKKKHKERIASLPLLLDPALEFGLHIFDRDFNIPGLSRRRRFPARYHTAIKGALDYAQVLTAYRCYDVMLNVNSVTQSSTMFSRRVFESLACGTPVVSTKSIGMRQMLGEHVRITHSAEETTAHLQVLLGDGEARNREAHLAYRFVHEHHTYRHRMNEMLSRIGLEPKEMLQPSVSIIVCVSQLERLANIFQNFVRQSYQEKELLLVFNNVSFDVEAIELQCISHPNVHILQTEPDTGSCTCLNEVTQKASGDYIAMMSEKDYYGDRYLSDMFLAEKYCDAEVLGKGSYFVHHKCRDEMALRIERAEHEYADLVAEATLLVRRNLVGKFSMCYLEAERNTHFLKQVLQAGHKIYSADRFNYIQVYQSDFSGKGTNEPKEVPLKECWNIQPGLDIERAII